jgi:YteA family regulatory protein
VGGIVDQQKLNHFRKKLLREKNNVIELLKQMEENEAFNSKVELSTELSELSMYDNHPSDLGSELFDQERGMALKEHELTIVKKIEDSLQNIEEGSYGTCKSCGKNIPDERLEFIPYAEFCVICQDEANSMRPREKNNRPIEESVLGEPFGYGFKDFDEQNYEVGYDAEDSYQDVQRFDWRKNADYDFLDEDADYVEPIEKISNQQYKNQLPD